MYQNQSCPYRPSEDGEADRPAWGDEECGEERNRCLDICKKVKGDPIRVCSNLYLLWLVLIVRGQWQWTSLAARPSLSVSVNQSAAPAKHSQRSKNEHLFVWRALYVFGVKSRRTSALQWAKNHFDIKEKKIVFPVNITFIGWFRENVDLTKNSRSCLSSLKSSIWSSLPIYV